MNTMVRELELDEITAVSGAACPPSWAPRPNGGNRNGCNGSERRDWMSEAREMAQRNQFLSGRGGSYPGRGGSGSNRGGGPTVKVNTAKGAGYQGTGAHVRVSTTF